MAGIIMAGKYGGFNNEGIPQYPANFPAIIFPGNNIFKQEFAIRE